MPLISKKDSARLRELARQQLEYAKSPAMETLKKEWLAHNTFRGQRPMLTVELGTFAPDILPPLMQCEGEHARELEAMLLKNIVNHTLFHDDTVVSDYLPVRWNTYFIPFDIEVKTEHSSAGGLGHHFVSVLKDLSQDYSKLQKSRFGVNRDATLNKLEEYNELFGDILPVRLSGSSLYCVLTQNIVHLMSMEDMFFAMYDTPELFLEMMNRLANDYLEYFQFLEQESLLLSTTHEELLGQGTYCFTDELPAQPKKTTDIWGFMDSQETSGISAEMFEEFIFPAYRKVAAAFGLLSYGCCEPVDPIWENCLSKLPNLRRVSISPWCNEKVMGEQLSGKHVIYHRKPDPTFLGVGDILDEEGLRRHIDATLDAAKGCTLEFTQRDVYQVSKSPEKVRRYVEIIREACADR
ncbi:MAG: hypothetical protein HFI90_03485 [Clostridia bacterium]|nr:hypothetical protein [Clostridia bacterium]